MTKPKYGLRLFSDDNVKIKLDYNLKKLIPVDKRNAKFDKAFEERLKKNGYSMSVGQYFTMYVKK